MPEGFSFFFTTEITEHTEGAKITEESSDVKLFIFKHHI
jgi:hypothetical protein